MISYLGDFPTSSVIYVPFTSYNTAGASVTLTGLAVTDIEIYKNGSTTQRASDAGYALLDTDGIDFDGVTGLHGFSIDTGDNTDAGFFAAGGEYWIAVSAVTVDSQTVNFVAGTFSIERTNGVLALLKGANGVAAIKADTAAILVDTGTTLDARIPAALVGGRMDSSVGAMAANTVTAAAIADGAIDAATFAAGAINAAAIAADAITDAKVASDVTIASVTGAVGSVTARVTANADQLAGQTITAAAGVTFPTSVASPTNITAGTITTVTNLTNAPTAGDLTATMKTSVTTAATAATPTISTLGANTITAASIAADAGAEIADAVWDEATAGHTTVGTTGKALTDAGSAGDPWGTALPGAYGAGTAGKIIGDNINATVSSRATPAQVATELGTYDAPTNAEMIARTLAAASYATASDQAAIKAKTDSLAFTVAGQVDANVQYVNDVQVSGTGALGDEWGPL